MSPAGINDPGGKTEPTLDQPLFGLGRNDSPGVLGRSPFTAQPGVSGENDAGDGVFGNSANGIGVHGRGGHLAGFFEGDVEVTGDIRLVSPGGDCAEDFDVPDGPPTLPGTVMVLDDAGFLRPSEFAYDKRVAGVISGAGGYRAGVTLDTGPSAHRRMPVALMGKVYCWADADETPIAVGDLLTTSGTTGHAMAASEPGRAFGTVIGKALGALSSGKELIPILVALQ